MDKRKVISIVVALLMLSIIGYKFNINKVNKNKEVDKVQVIDTKEENNMFAFMIQGDNGKYTPSQSNTWPGEGYKLNIDNTKCMDNNGVEVKNGITYNASTNLVTVNSSNTSYCYLYFDQAGKGGLEILENLPASSGLSTSKLGDMRRYQGTSVKNYICINDTGAKCNSGSNEMYRIIGVVEDGDEEGQIKVIKETKYGKYAWNGKYFIDSGGGNYYCGSEGCPEWPNNDLAKTINTTFLNSISTKVQNVIVSRQWYYGDLSGDAQYSDKDVNTIYQIETGKINTNYYNNSGKIVSTESWKKISNPLKIGLIYLHDYMWQSTQERCHSTQSLSISNQCKDNGWMHLSKNESSTDAEWTMTREGRGGSYAVVDAWQVYFTGAVGIAGLHVENAIRPVFYLSSDVKIKEGGTGEKTNPYILDLS